jgi:hypothetical protein
MRCSRKKDSRKGFARLANPRLAFANLGHPYGVATTLTAVSARCFVNLPQQVVCSSEPGDRQRKVEIVVPPWSAGVILPKA